MSIAEFYTEYGLDPSDPYHMDSFLRQQREGSWYGAEDEDSLPDLPNDIRINFGFPDRRKGENAQASRQPEKSNDNCKHSDRQKRQRESNGKIRCDFRETHLDHLAVQHGYSKIETSSSTAPMASYRRGACRLNFWLTTGTVGSYLQHPRQGKTQLFRRNITMEGAEQIFQNPRIHTGQGYRRNHNNEKSGSRGPCRYGQDCYRADCKFEHHYSKK